MPGSTLLSSDKASNPDSSSDKTGLQAGRSISKSSLTATPAAAPRNSPEEVQTEKTVQDEPTIEEHDNTAEHLEGWKLAVVITGACLGVFCTGLDYAIIATAIPRITDTFKSINDVGFYGSAYFLTACAFQLFYGKLYLFFQRKWVFATAIVIFEVGNIVCATATTSTAFIVGRAVAGLGSAGIFSGALLLVAYSMPLQARPPYLGLIQSMNGLASVLGPVIGGAITDNPRLTWRWCFWINVPFGAVTVVFIFLSQRKSAAMRSLDRSSWKTQIRSFDPLGTLTFAPSMICLLLALQWGGSTYAWNDGRVIVLWILFGVLLIAFIAIQIHEQDNATVPPKVIMQRTVAGSVWFTFWQASAMFIMLYYLPLWFQAIKGWTAIQSGYQTLPMGVSIVITSIITASLPAIIGYYTQFIWTSTVLMGVGSGLITLFTVETSIARWVGYQIVFGIGIGFGISVTNVAIQTVLPPALIPAGTSVNMLCQMAGGAVFISVGQNVLTNSLLRGILSTVPGIAPTDIIRAGATELATSVDAKFFVAVREVYNGALVNVFYVAVATCCVTVFGAVLVEWRSVKHGQHVQAPPVRSGEDEV